MDTNLSIGMIDTPVDLRAALLESEMGFFEVPAFDRKHPSTSFSIRGRQLTVDLLTPMRRRTSTRPVEIKSLGAAAEPVRFLDYLLATTEPAVIVARAGILVNVPTPARYALHKLVTAERRPVAMQSKGLKDLAQAQQLIELLINDRPGDLLLAWEATQNQPPGFRQQLNRGIKKLPQALRAYLKSID